MILNRIEPGTICTSRKTGEAGKINKIFFYPTKYEVEFSDGRIEHYSSKDLEFEGIVQKEVSLKLPEVPEKGIGDSWCEWVPFKSESFIEHHFSTSKEIIWEMLTSLEMYNVWFYGIQRALPEVDSDRFVHKYSFSKLELKPGAYFKIRPMTIAPWFRCRIMTYEKEKEFGFTFQTTPFSVEFVHFSVSEAENGVWVKCSRKSEGLFSVLDQMNWQEKSKILQELDQIIPKVNSEDSIEDKGSSDQIRAQSASSAPGQSSGGFESLSRDDQIAYLVNKALDGDMDAVNNFQDKVIRGKTKAMMVKIKRGSVERPPMPNVGTEIAAGTQAGQSSGGFESLSKDDQIAYLVNKALDGDMDAVNNFQDKIIRGKTKAMMVKIKRGSVERPPMPNIDSQPASNSQSKEESETDEKKIERLTAMGLEGEMDEINALENKVMRGKIKAAIIRAKRASK